MRREFPITFESTNLSRDNLSREIGRKLFADRGSKSQIHRSSPIRHGV